MSEKDECVPKPCHSMTTRSKLKEQQTEKSISFSDDRAASTNQMTLHPPESRSDACLKTTSDCASSTKSKANRPPIRQNLVEVKAVQNTQMAVVAAKLPVSKVQK